MTLKPVIAHGLFAIMLFTRVGLEEAGFRAWVRFEEVRSADCPAAGGVYVVAYGGAPQFASESCGGWFKGKNPSISAEALSANWVEGAEVVYIGKADVLKRRLTEFADFGAGKPIGHWGGRLIWQLDDVAALRVAWKETPGRVPAMVEASLIAEFRRSYGKPPFANEPHRLGR